MTTDIPKRELEDLAEALTTASEGISDTATGIQEALRAIRDLAGEAKGSGSSFSRHSKSMNVFSDEMDRFSTSMRGKVEHDQANIIARKEDTEQEYRHSRAVKSSVESLTSFGSALLEGKEGFSKYGQGIKEASSSLSDFAGSMGKWGKVAQVVIAGFSYLSTSALKYSDQLLKSADTLGQIGVAGGLTTEEIRKMAAGAKYSTSTMDGWTKALGTMGPSLAGFGSGVTDGVKEFGKLTELSRDQISHYQALGYSQEQLTQAQADSIGYIQKSGTLITEKMKTDGTIQKMSLEYVDNLSRLSALTGQSVAEAKKTKDEALAHAGLQVKYAKMDKEARDLEAAGRKDEAAAIRQRKENMKTMVEAASATGDSAQLAGVQRYAATDGKVKTKEMAQMAVGTPEIFHKMDEAMSNQDKAQRMQFEFADAQRRNMERAPDSVMISDQLAKSFGISAEGAQKSAPFAGKTKKEQDDWVKSAKSKKVGETAAEGDSVQKGRKVEQTLAFAAQTFKDGVIDFVGPMKLAILGFAGSVLAFGVSVAANFGGGGLLGKLAGLLGKGGGAAAEGAAGAGAAAEGAAGAGAAGAGAAGALGKAAKVAGKWSGPLAAAGAVYEGYGVGSEGWDKAKSEVDSGKISKSEGAYKKSQAVGEGVGTAVGGAAGGWAGATAGASGGAALGLLAGPAAPIVSPLLAILGGIGGGLAGAWGGGKLGGMAGKEAGSSVGLAAASLTENDKPGEESGKKEVLADGPQSVFEQHKKLMLTQEIKDLYSTKGDSKKTILDIAGLSTISSLLSSGKEGPDKEKGVREKIMASLKGAADGGTFDGPKTGYPVMLHGNETVTPNKTPLKDGEGGSGGIGTVLKQSVSILERFNIQLIDASDTLAELNGTAGKADKSMAKVASEANSASSANTKPRMPEDATSVAEAKKLGEATPGKARSAPIKMNDMSEPGKSAEGLGSLSARFESARKGSSAIGEDRTGGASYGKYQIATKTGTMKEFLNYAKTNNKDLYEQLAPHASSAGDTKGDFAKKWQELAKGKDSAKLGELEHAFIKKTHFDESAKKLSKTAGFDVTKRSKALQDVLWSTSVQHGSGGAASIFKKSGDLTKMSDQDIMAKVYAERGKHFGGSTEKVRNQQQDRFRDEHKMAVAALDKEKSGGTDSTLSAQTNIKKLSAPAPKASEKAREPGIMKDAPKIESLRADLKQTPEAAAAKLAAASLQPKTAPAAKSENFSDAISKLGDRISDHFAALINHTKDGNDSLNKMQKQAA